MVFTLIKYLLNDIRSVIFEKLKTRATVRQRKIVHAQRHEDVLGSGDVTLHIRKIGIRCGWAVSSSLRPFGRTNGLKKRGRWTKSKIPARKIVINHCKKLSCSLSCSKRLSCCSVVLPLRMFVMYVLFIPLYGLFSDAIGSADYIAKRINTNFNVQNICLHNWLVYPRLNSENVRR